MTEFIDTSTLTWIHLFIDQNKMLWKESQQYCFSLLHLFFLCFGHPSAHIFILWKWSFLKTLYQEDTFENFFDFGNTW